VLVARYRAYFEIFPNEIHGDTQRDDNDSVNAQLYHIVDKIGVLK
jgi:hypothetical protein